MCPRFGASLFEGADADERGDTILRVRMPLILLLAILTIGAFARYHRLGQVPRGLWVDETADGNDAAQATNDHYFRVFYPDNAGREDLWINLMALSIARFVHTPFAARFFAPLAGSLTILFLYLLAARWFGARVALLGAWFLATSFWHVDLSRIAVRGILVPLFLMAALYFLQCAWDANGMRSAILAVLGGAAYGLGFHSYIAFRVTPLLIVVLVGLEWRSPRGSLRHIAQTTALWLGAAFLVVLPLGFYFLRNPQDFWTRISQVSVFSAPRPMFELLRSLVRTLLMFNYKGDCNWRHNLACSPELIWPVGIFFLLGVWLSFRHWRRDRSGSAKPVFLLAWCFLLLVPAFLTRESVPHSLRAVGALPAVVLLAAIGADWLLTLCADRRLLFGILLGVVVLSGTADLYRYFFIWARHPEVAEAFQYRVFQAAARIKTFAPDTFVLVAIDEPQADWPATGFRHRNPDGTIVLLPELAQIPIFVTANRTNMIYLLSRQLGESADRSFLGCGPGSLPMPQTLPPLEPISVSGCAHSLVVLRLPS
jgi:Dolichyl-phosphate-mannose-protein mannosyltransferase